MISSVDRTVQGKGVGRTQQHGDQGRVDDRDN